MFRTQKKLDKIKNNNLNKLLNSKNDSNDNNLSSTKNMIKKERISVVSKNKSDINTSKEDAKEENNKNNEIIIKSNINSKNNNNDFNSDNDGKNIDISIQFEKGPIKIDYNNNNKDNNNDKNNNYDGKNPNNNNVDNKKDRHMDDYMNNDPRYKYYSSTDKKAKNYKYFKELNDSLYKDLREINGKFENRKNYLKKHHHNLEFQRHFGDEETCPICREMRKRGKKEEREKGLFSAFNFFNFKGFKTGKRSLKRLKFSSIQKNLNSKRNDLISEERKKLGLYSLNNINKNNIHDFRNKYMQFNGMNRIRKLNRFGSAENVYSNFERNNSNNNLKKGEKEYEKNIEGENSLEYPLLKNYFHEDNFCKTNDYYN
jgi:hypothetical protein